MQTGFVVRCAVAIVVGILVGRAEAKEVTFRHMGLTLNADLELAAEKKLADGVILVTHGSLAHRDMEAIAYLRELLKERGHSTLAINLSLGLDNRHGMYDCTITHRHRNDDAAKEIGAWVGWLKEQGEKNVVLLGHSRGGAQTALYAAEQGDALVKAVVLLAPATGDNNSPAAYQRRHNQALAPRLDKARTLVDDGKGGTVLEHVGLLSCLDTPATADSFVSYYGQDPRLDALYLIPKIEKPTLVVVAGADAVVVDLDKKVAPLAKGTGVQMAVIDGADHLFRDLFADEAVDAIEAFLN